MLDARRLTVQLVANVAGFGTAAGKVRSYSSYHLHLFISFMIDLYSRLQSFSLFDS